MEVNQDNNNENTSSGIDSEIFSNDNEPPQKLYITENENGEKHVHGRRSPTKNKEFVHKMRAPQKNPSQLFRSSEPTTEKGL